MKTALIIALLAGTGPAFAGDAANGATVFKKCAACHAITAADGAQIRSGGKIGPNLYAVIGRTVAGVPDYPYSASLLAVGSSGVIWDQEKLAAYVANPTIWLQSNLGDESAKSNMPFKLGKGGADVAAYLASVGPMAP